MSARRTWRVRLALGLLALLMVGVVAGPLLWRVSPETLDLARAHAPPGAGHPLGTDASGRDVLSRLLAGGRVSLAVGALSMLVSLLVGATAGLVAGWRGGWVDSVVMRSVDTALAIPTLFVVILTLTFLGSSVPVLVAAIGLTTWMGVARIVRAEATVARTQSFVDAARALGRTDLAIVWNHLVPQLAPTLLVAASVGVSTAILTESALSFLGLGVQPPSASWGNMLSDAQGALYVNPALAIYPGVLIFLTVVCVNTLGDVVRDRLDPRTTPTTR